MDNWEQRVFGQYFTILTDVLLVFHRKDLCDARPKPEVCSKFQMRHTPQ